MIKWYWRDGTLAANGDDPDWLTKTREISEKMVDDEYRIVRQERLPYGIEISTVWIALDRQFTPGGPPLIFETMVFDASEEILEGRRYSTEADAIAGHEEIKKKYQ